MKLLAALFALMLAVGLVTLWLWRRSPEPEPCQSRTVAQSRSPDDRSDAEIYELKCGASLTTHIALRPAMASLPGYVPGRTMPGAIKLASNETPLPPLPHVLSRIAEAAGTVNRYPDNWSAELG